LKKKKKKGIGLNVVNPKVFLFKKVQYQKLNWFLMFNFLFFKLFLFFYLILKF